MASEPPERYYVVPAKTLDEALAELKRLTVDVFLRLEASVPLPAGWDGSPLTVRRLDERVYVLDAAHLAGDVEDLAFVLAVAWGLASETDTTEDGETYPVPTDADRVRALQRPVPIASLLSALYRRWHLPAPALLTAALAGCEPLPEDPDW